MKTYKVIETHPRYRIYEFANPLKVFPNKNFHIEKELEYSKTRLKKDFEIVEESIGKYVIVSDARTHTERLCFLGCQMYDKTKQESFVSRFSSLQISGKHTMVIHGGNPKDVYPDEVYLRHLQILNSKG